MKFDRDDGAFGGKPLLSCVRYAATRYMASTGKLPRKVHVSPGCWDILMAQLIDSRDPSLRAEWDGPRCYLRFAINGREVLVHAREGMVDFALEVE